MDRIQEYSLETGRIGFRTIIFKQERYDLGLLDGSRKGRIQEQGWETGRVGFSIKVGKQEG